MKSGEAFRAVTCTRKGWTFLERWPGRNKVSNNRLPPPYGLRLQRQKPISFTFDGKRFTGYSGDTIASALAANNQWLLSRSFKYHRPRGVLTMAGQDANTLVQLPSNPNALADVEKICPDLKVSCQNVSGSLQRDRLSWLGYLSRFLPDRKSVV